MKRPLLIVGGGAVTAVGVSASQTCAAIRGAIAGFAESDFFQHSIDPVPLNVAQVPLGPPPQEDRIFDRLIRMVIQALRECLTSAHIDPSRTALLLGVREPFREHPDLDGNDAVYLPAIERALGLQFHASSSVLPDGNAAVFNGLIRARSLLDTNTVDTCIVGGVDSYLNPYDLRIFEDIYRLNREGVAQGFIAGEGAAFLAVTASAPARKQIVQGEILGIGLANEDPKVTVLSDGHPTGKGLQRALEATVQDAQRPESSISFRVSDLNGEYYRGIESVLAQSRFYRASRQQLELWLPAASVGEIGSAIGALMIIMALAGMEKGYAPGDLAMCEASSDTGLRGGCLVSRFLSQSIPRHN